MSKKILIPLFTICLLASCGDDSASNANNENGGSNLPPQQGTEIPCDAGNEGLEIKPADSENPRLCTNGEWVEILSSSSSIKTPELAEGSSSSSIKAPELAEGSSSSSVKAPELAEGSSSSSVKTPEPTEGSSSSTPIEDLSSSSEESKMYLCDDGVTYVLNLANCANSSSSSKDPEPVKESSSSSKNLDPIEESSSSIASGSKVAWKYLNPNIDYGEFTDTRDGQVYKTITIGTQTWMAQNLNYAYTGMPYKNGSYTSDSTSWCYNNKESYCDRYGRLYTWAAAMDSAGITDSSGAGKGCGYFGTTTCRVDSTSTTLVRGVCPEGWHLPNKAEWKTLQAAVKSSDPDLMLKSTSDEWGYYKGSDSIGFAVLPAGVCVGNYFHDNGNATFFWGPTPNYSFQSADASYFESYGMKYRSVNMFQGGSVRCIKNSDEVIAVSSSSVIASSSSSFEVEGICKTEFEDNCVYGSLYDERDGQTYKTVKVGDQWWMAENLKFKHSNPEYTEYMKCQLDDEENCNTYGVLYHSKIAPESCPEGWIVPSRTEWVKLKDYVSKYIGRIPAGQAIRSQEGWNLNGTGKGYDYFGLNIKPGGGYDGYYLSDFYATTKYAYFAQNDEPYSNGCYYVTTVRHELEVYLRDAFTYLRDTIDLVIGKQTYNYQRNCLKGNYVYIRCIKE